MVAIDDTLDDLALLYHAVGGTDNYEIWDETVHGAGLQEIISELEEGEDRYVGRQTIIDYWDGLMDVGLMDGSWQLTELGEDWKNRTESALQSLYMTGADIGDDRQAMGDIFHTLGAENVLPALHVFYNDLEPEEHLGSVNVNEPAEKMYHHGFIQDEAYRNADWQPDADILTERAETVYEEVVESDYGWLENSGYEL